MFGAWGGREPVGVMWVWVWALRRCCASTHVTMRLCVTHRELARFHLGRCRSKILDLQDPARCYWSL